MPPKIHRRNAAERAIQTFKNHFLAGIATYNPKFPINEWDRLFQQAERNILPFSVGREEIHQSLRVFPQVHSTDHNSFWSISISFIIYRGFNRFIDHLSVCVVRILLRKEPNFSRQPLRPSPSVDQAKF